MTRVFDPDNAALNNFMKETLSLQINEHVLKIGFGTGKLINEISLCGGLQEGPG